MRIKVFCSFFIFLLTITAPSILNAQSDQVVPMNIGGQDTDRDLVEIVPILSVASAAPGKTYRAALVVDIEENWHINSIQPYDDWLISAKLDFGESKALTPSEVTFPEAHDFYQSDLLMSVYSGEIVFLFDVSVAENLSPGDYTLPIKFTYQPCNNRECRAPQTLSSELVVTVGDEGEAINPEIFAQASGPDHDEDVAASVAAAEPESELQKWIDKYGFWGYLIALGLAFVTGLLLSFSPCTYPMIPITVSVFAGQQRSIGKGFLLSLVYVASMAVVYGLMGLIVSLVGGVFGAWLANPIVVVIIAIVFVVFSLSMFGLYELQVPMSLRMKLGRVSSESGGGGVFSVIILGIIAALIVSPCVGPFVAGILLYIATTGSPALGFLTLFIFALGLGTLYIIIGTFSSSINKLPGAGEWMESVKKFFGFVLLLMALYFLRTLISPYLIALLTGLLLLAFGVFGGGLDRLTPESKFFPRLKKFLGLLALIIGIYLLAGTILQQGLILPPASHWLPATSNVDKAEEKLIDWNTDLDQGLALAKSTGKPVLIDTWATWCANCRVLEKKTFSDPDVAIEVKRFVPLKIQLETVDSDITRNFMNRFGMKHYSLPTTLILNSKGEVEHVIQGVIGPDELIERLKQVS